MAVQRDKKGENANSLWTLYHGHMYLTYDTIAGDIDRDDGRKEEDFLQKPR